MDGLAQLAAQQKPINIGGKWFYEGVQMTPQEIQGMQRQQQAMRQQAMQVQDPQMQGQDPRVQEAYRQAQANQAFGKNPIGAAARSLAGMFGF